MRKTENIEQLKSTSTMYRYAASLAIMFLLLMASFASAQVSVDRQWRQAMLDSAKEVMTRKSTPGLWLVVVDSGEVVISETMGLASVIGPTPLTRETVVRLPGSNELAINLAILKLAEMKRLELDAQIGSYVEVPDFLNKVTARQLITNRAGLRAKHFSTPLWKDEDLALAVKSWDKSIFIAEPGETRSHSHYSIALAGYLVELVVGKPFPDAMRELVWEPMGVSAGISRISDALVLPMAQGHELEEDKMEVVKPLGLGFNGWPGDAAFLSLETMEGLATALAQPANSGVDNGGIAKPQWQSGWGWAGVSFRLIVDVERGFSALIADNGGGASGELATMIEWQVLEQAAPEAPQPIDWQEPTKEAMALLPGVYKNEGTIEIVLRDDKLVVLSSSGYDPAQIMQGPDMQFGLFIDDGAGGRRNVMTFAIESTHDGKMRHLRIGSRVWLRTESLDTENNKKDRK
jgi:CubicO group peptidase (beta-lactamase class C family)